MNREIKFRAWDKKNKLIIKMVHFIDFFNKKIFGKKFLAEDGYIPFKDIILLQYTGLKDNKRTKEYPEGQEIYEGDVVIHHYFEERFTVIWEKKQSRIALKYLDKSTQEMFPIDSEHFEIIGNIYENPELLEDTK